MIKSLKVTTPLKKYNIIIGNNIIASSGKYSKKYLKSDRVFIVTNKLLKSLYLKKIKKSFVKHGITVSEIIINDSENKKNLESVKILTSHLLKNKVDNDNQVIELIDDISKDLFNFDLEYRIAELESRFSKDMSETTFNELKDLKNERKIN